MSPELLPWFPSVYVVRVTGCTGSLAMLDDETIILAFGHKDDTYDESTKTWKMFGQRAVISHDRCVSATTW
eukprot:COSAG05_NODE_7673_length_781_cov_1.658358_1_plen_71_part_00